MTKGISYEFCYFKAKFYLTNQTRKILVWMCKRDFSLQVYTFWAWSEQYEVNHTVSYWRRSKQVVHTFHSINLKCTKSYREKWYILEKRFKISEKRQVHIGRHTPHQEKNKASNKKKLRASVTAAVAAAGGCIRQKSFHLSVGHWPNYLPFFSKLVSNITFPNVKKCKINYFTLHTCQHHNSMAVGKLQVLLFSVGNLQLPTIVGTLTG